MESKTKNTELATKEDQHGYNLAYMDSKRVEEIAEIVKRGARWAEKMNNVEIGLAVRRAMSLGVDPLNPHEIQIWKDNRGTVNTQLAYSMIIEWVRMFKGPHTSPRYYRLTPEQLEEEGLNKSDVAYRCKFFMLEDLDKMTSLSDIFDASDAQEMFAVVGLGSASAGEYNGKYFAPNGRSPSWKVQKRALADAYRRKFGDPTTAEIIALRRSLGYDSIKPEDWLETGKLAPGDAVALADAKAKERTDEPMSAEDLQAAQGALFGDAQDLDYEDVEEQTMEPEPEPELEPDAPRDWRAACRGIYKELRNQGIEFSLDKDFSWDQFHRSHTAMEEAVDELALGSPPAEVQTYLVAKIEEIKRQ